MRELQIKHILESSSFSAYKKKLDQYFVKHILYVNFLYKPKKKKPNNLKQNFQYIIQ